MNDYTNDQFEAAYARTDGAKDLCVKSATREDGDYDLVCFTSRRVGPYPVNVWVGKNVKGGVNARIATCALHSGTLEGLHREIATGGTASTSDGDASEFGVSVDENGTVFSAKGQGNGTVEVTLAPDAVAFMRSRLGTIITEARARTEAFYGR